VLAKYGTNTSAENSTQLEQLAKETKNTYLQSPTATCALTVIRYTNNGPWVFCVPIEINNFISASIFEAKKKEKV